MDVSRHERGKRIPLHITIRPVQTQCNMVKAKEEIEDSLINFLDCTGAQERLLYELALTIEGETQLKRDCESGVVEQRRLGTNKVSSMKLLDLPYFRSNVLFSFRKDVQERLHQETQCTVDVFSQVITSKLPDDLCKPFSLICGKTKNDVDKAAMIVASIINSYQQRGQMYIEEPATSSNVATSLSSKRKHEQPHESHPLQHTNKRNYTEHLEYKTATCTLEVPLWVLLSCIQDNELLGNQTCVISLCFLP